MEHDWTSSELGVWREGFAWCRLCGCLRLGTGQKQRIEVPIAFALFYNQPLSQAEVGARCLRSEIEAGLGNL